MPTSSSSCYNFTFRPTYEEFNEYNSLFLDRIENNYNKYIVSYEKGSGEVHNHLQGFLELPKEIRADNFRKKFNKLIMKDMVISNPKIAIKIKPVNNDVKRCQGYILKENKLLEDVYWEGYTSQYLMDCYDYYESLTLEKKIKVDRVRINNRNVCDCIDNWLSSNKKYKKERYELEDVREILGHMGNSGYYILPLLKGFKLNVLYITNYLNKNLHKLLLKVDK